MGNFRLKGFIALSIVSLSYLPSGSGVYASQNEETRFRNQVTVGQWTLVKKGSGVLEYLGFIDAYAGAFYTLPDIAPNSVLTTDTPKHLEIHYFHAIDSEDFASATARGVRKTVSGAVYATLRERLERFNRLYRDVMPGDRYALTYTPGGGTVLSLNGEPLGRLHGHDFAAAIFGLWLGDDPLDDRFKSSLLGEAG